MSLRCGANCLNCSIELQKIRGWYCRFKEMYYSNAELAVKRKEQFYAELNKTKEMSQK